MRPRGVLMILAFGIGIIGCDSTSPAARAATKGKECEPLTAMDNRGDTIVQRAKLTLSFAARGDSARLASLVTNDTLVRKMLGREKSFYRTASEYVESFCVVDTAADRVEIDLRFPYSGAGRNTEHYQMVFVRGRTGWMLDRDIVWTQL